MDLSLYVGSSQPRIDEQVKIDLNEREEICFKWQGSCIGVTKLAHSLLDLVIDNSLRVGQNDFEANEGKSAFMRQSRCFVASGFAYLMVNKMETDRSA